MNLETDENNGDCGFASEAQIDTSTSDDFDNPLFDQPKRVCWRGHTKTNLPFFDECLTPHIQDTNTRDGASDPSQSAISIHLCSTQEDRFVELSAIVDSCCHAELVYLHQTIEPLLKRDFVCQLPLELSLQILSYLSLGDILRCAKVSHSWNRVVSDQLLWYRLCRRDRVLSSTTSDTQVTTPHPLLHENVCSTFQSIDPTSSGPICQTNLDWKSVYRVSLETQCNWRNGSPWAPVILPAHHNHVITCLEVYNDWAITGSDDSSICIWSLSRGELLMNLFGHIGGVWCLTVLPADALPGRETPILVSGSCDRSARVWLLDGSRWPCVATLFGHQSTVRCVAGQNRVSDPMSGSASTGTGEQVLANLAQSRSFLAAGSTDLRLVVTGSRDTTLRLWNAVSGQCVRVFEGHLGAIRCVQFTGTMVVSGSYDSTVRVWCILTGVCLRVLSGHKNRVYTLLFDGSHIISASLDTTIRVWDAFTGHLKRTFCGHRSLTSEMAYGSLQRILVSSNADETIRVWNVDTGECMYVLAGHHKHQSAVTSVRLTRHFVVSSGDDGTVKLWDRHTGAYIRDLVRLDGAGRGGVIWRIVSSENRLVCAAGSRNGLETTKLVILQFNEPIGSLSGEKAVRHQCRSRLVQPAPSPQLSQVLAAHTFHTDMGGDSTPTD